MKFIFFTLLLFLTLLSGCATKTEKQHMAELEVIDSSALRKQPSSGDRSVPNPKFRTPAMAQRAAPTNQWYSSIMYQRWGEAIYATPLTAKPTDRGLEVAFPEKRAVVTHRKDVDIYYSHSAELTISPIQFQPNKALLGNYSDWAVDIEMASTKQTMRATLSHGSPFVYLRSSKGGFAISFAKKFKAHVAKKYKNVLIIESSSKTFAAFAPEGKRWSQNDGVWLMKVGQQSTYLSIAALPNNIDKTFVETLDDFYPSAFAFITNTKVDWSINHALMQVKTSYTFETEQMEGEETAPIIGLYPHHYHRNVNIPNVEVGVLQSIRGPIRLFKANDFITNLTHNGFVPFWPKVQASSIQGDLKKQLRRDIAASRRMLLEEGEGPYWQGKGLQRITQLMHVAKVQGNKEQYQELLNKIKKRAEKWLRGRSEKTYFHYDSKTGTVVSYPEEYDAVLDMNDHHFHYGYWIRAAAEIAMADPKWARQWGGLIDKLVEDIATSERGLKAFPFIRNFDPYEGHSWASGVGRGPDGNNQESSSEAVNAWAALMLWGSVRNRPELVDLGIYLYNTEIESARHYWFDIYGLTLPEEYVSEGVCIVFGGKVVHYTWWTDEPRQTHGINLLPLTPSSTYLAIDAQYILRDLKSIEKETVLYESRYKKAEPEDIWQDIFAKYLALADPEKGFAQWNQYGSFELGDTRTHAFHWLQTLREVGTPELTISANTPFYAVFEHKGRKTYMVYNFGADNKGVQFSDGKQMQAVANQLTVEKGE